MNPVTKVLRAVGGRLGRPVSTPPNGARSRRPPDDWQALAEPVPGHSTIDGIPVPVVAVRRNPPADTLEVVRGFGADASPGASAAPGVQRHVVPALSFIPHPRRRLLIDKQLFFFGSVPNAARCDICGGEYHGFGFVNSGPHAEGGDANSAEHNSLCERCAAKCADS